MGRPKDCHTRPDILFSERTGRLDAVIANHIHYGCIDYAKPEDSTYVSQLRYYSDVIIRNKERFFSPLTRRIQQQRL